ncbi:MAG: hypothetical protein JW881_18325 [Spirochaetales bacterium]|nr:hypothetical protein [Spirochaetales bacterium]
MKHHILLISIICVIVAGCASGPSFTSGECSPEDMVKLLHPEANVFFVVNVGEMKKNDYITRLFFTAMKEIKELNAFLNECDIDLEEDVYFLSVGLIDFIPGAKNNEGSVIINLRYDRKLLADWLKRDGFTENENTPSHIAVYTKQSGDGLDCYAFLSDSLVFMGSESVLAVLLDPEKEEKAESLLSIAQTVEMNAAGFGGITTFGDFLNASDEDNAALVMTLFSGVASVAFSVDVGDDDLLVQCLLLVADEDQKATIFTIMNLSKSQASSGADNPALAGIMKSMKVTKEEKGVMLEMSLPLSMLGDVISSFATE